MHRKIEVCVVGRSWEIIRGMLRENRREIGKGGG